MAKKSNWIWRVEISNFRFLKCPRNLGKTRKSVEPYFTAWIVSYHPAAYMMCSYKNAHVKTPGELSVFRGQASISWLTNINTLRYGMPMGYRPRSTNM